MAKDPNPNLFARLGKLFRSGPVIKRTVKDFKTQTGPGQTLSAYEMFRKNHSSVYSSAMSAYGTYDRLARYSDFAEMDYYPEINSALDIYSEEVASPGIDGQILSIYSENKDVERLLGELFFDTLNVNFNLTAWVRNLPVHKDTVIPLLDGSHLTIAELAQRMKSEPDWQPWVYAVQDGTNQTVPGRVSWCDLTRKDTSLVRIWLDDGSYVDCTPDHEWVLRDGSRKKAEDLLDGVALMPFYREVSTKKHRLSGYEIVYNPPTEEYEFTHRLVSASAVPSPALWHVVHHVNFNKRDNTPDNLRKMTRKDHTDLHMAASKILQRPDVAAKRMAGIDKWLRSSDHRKFAGEQLKRLQAAGLMRTSWSDYNASSQQAVDNVNRAATMRRTWETKRHEILEKITINFDEKCVDLLIEVLMRVGKFISLNKTGRHLVDDETFMSYFTSINPLYGRDLTRSVGSAATLKSLLGKAGVKSYYSLIEERIPEISCTPWFKRARKKSERLIGIVPNMRENHLTSHYMNHKVVRVERLKETSDVYCMEVLGPQGEHDRHNFAVLTRDVDGSVKINSGIYSQNCKYGDFCLFNDVHPGNGVLNVIPIPINEIEREENYDPKDPMAVRYRWITQGNTPLENWQVTHFRLLGNDAFLPYGSSVLEGARRVWRQLVLAEDAMLVYRVVRSPDRRVFYIDVGNVPPEEVPMYMEQAQAALKKSQVVDKNTGRVDMRYNPMCNSLNTSIKLQDGRMTSLGDFIKEWEGGKQDQWVYSVDLDGKRLVPGKVVWAGVTRRDAEMVRVHIDSGVYFDCTPDHRFMLRDGSYREASQLQPDDALMPLYSKTSAAEDGSKLTGYEKIYDPFAQTYSYTHRCNVIATAGFDAIVGKVIHHADFDKRNNNPENLAPMTWKDHHDLHGNMIVEYNKSDRGRANSRSRMKKTWESGKIEAKTFVDLWKRDDIRQKRVEKLSLRVDAMFIDHCMTALDKLGTGISTRECDLISELNSSKEFASYLQALNPDFKNGFNDRVTRSSLQKHLRMFGFKKPIEDLKRKWLLSRVGTDQLVKFCEARRGQVKRQDILRHFNMNRSSYQWLASQACGTFQAFNQQYVQRAADSEHIGYMNHKVVRVEKLEAREDTGCITVEKYHNFAAGPALHLHNEDMVAKSLIFIHNSVDEDYFIPVRGGESGTKIDTLAGGTNATAIEDVQYIQKKLFAALKIPKAYLGYDESIGSKATLSQEDIRFSRTVARIQRTVIAELNKLAIIHLYSNGFDGDDLLDFTLQLPNPSTIAQQQKLDLYGTRFDIVSKAPDGYFDKRWLRKNLLGLTDEEIELIEEGRVKDKLREMELEKVQAESEGGGVTPEPTEPTGGEIGGGMGEPPPMPPPPPEASPGGASGAPATPSPKPPANQGAEGEPAPKALDEFDFSISDEDSPVRAQRMIDRSVNRLSDLPVVLSEARKARTRKKGESQEDHAYWLRYNAGRRKAGGNLRASVDHKELVGHDAGDERDAITHPYGEKKDHSPSLRDLTPGLEESMRDIDEVVKKYTSISTNDLNATLRSLKAGLPKREEQE